VTEDEAKACRCPYVQPVTNCVGSQCMAWKWYQKMRIDIYEGYEGYEEKQSPREEWQGECRLLPPIRI
jgi:hypothetical protein